MNKLITFGFACSVVALAYADAATLGGNTYRIIDTADASYTVRSVFETTAWPSDLPTPLFRFDCKQTNGWEFTTDEQGRLRVTKIPSLNGGRYLTAEQMDSGTKTPSWDQKSPVYVAADPELGGQPMIDLADGKSLNSQIGLNFNAVTPAGGSAKLNLLENIGTVVAVYNSKLGGGDFLGGGRDGGTGAPKELWKRSRTSTFSAKSPDSVQVDYPSAILGTTYSPLSFGLARHDGLESGPCDSGYAGRWEVLAMCPTENATSATGIGMGGLDAYYHSGGMQIAEMVFFTEVLDKSQVAEVERYLTRKWFPERRENDGYNGRTTLGWYRSVLKGSSLKATFDIPANETLAIGKLQGGRKKGTVEPKIVKTGAGTLEVGDFACYPGTVESQGGTVAFRKEPVPALDELAEGMYIRFAADEASCLELVNVNGTNFVSALKNLASGVYKDLPVVAHQTDATLRPWIREKGLGGKSVIDFGLGCEGANGRTLRWANGNASPYSNITLPSAYTVVALIGAQNGGGHIMDNMLQRSTRWCGGAGVWSGYGNSSDWYNYGLLEKENTYTSAPGHYIALNAVNGTAFVNGRKLSAYTQGYETPSYQVAAWRVPGYINYRLGGESDTTVHGQFRLAEIMIWLRPLTDEELLDAQAYLAKKWLDTTLAGYRDDAKNGVAQVQKLEVTGTTSVDVPADAAARVDTLVLDSPGAELVKTGPGTLYVAKADNSEYSLVVKGGTVRVLEPQVTEQCQLAANPTMHLDASDRNSFILWPKNGKNYVQRWMSKTGLYGACESHPDEASPSTGEPEKNNPWLDTVNTLNGMPCVNFGTPSYGWGRSNPMMYFDRSIDGVRSVYVVLGSQNGGNDLFGGCSTVADTSDGIYDWECTVSGGKRATLFGNANANVKNGEIRVDGVLTTANANPQDWSLVEVHTLGGVAIASLNCRHQGTYNRGGNRYCEIVVYERVLSEREKVATRNYLTRKWFPSRALEPLPAAGSEAVAAVKAYAADAGETNVVDAAATQASGLQGEGVVAKTSEGVLEVTDLSGFEGTLDVRAGTVSVTRTPVTNDVSLVEDGRILHLDAMDDSTLTHVTESDTGRDTVSRWASKVGGIAAVPMAHHNNKAVTNMPYYLSHDLNGCPIIDMYSKTSEWNGRRCSMVFVDANGAKVNLKRIRTAFWVLGSQNGGGLLFGGGYTNTVNVVWFRNTTSGGGQSSGADYREGLIGYQATLYWPCLREAGYWVNEVKTPSYATPEVLSGGYDLVAMRLKDGVTDDKAPNSDGLAFFNEKEGNRNYRGNQRLGELIVYDRVLTDAEMAQVHAYLRAKWGYTQKTRVNDAAVNLATGARLVTAGNQYLDTLTGSGTVDGDVTVKNFVADGSPSAKGVKIDGTLTFEESPTFTLTNLPADLSTASIAVASATAYEGTEHLVGATIVGLPSDKFRAKVAIENGKLVIVVKSIRGMLLLFW